MSNLMLSNMIHLATSAHNCQYDKAGEPYILHCLKVMHLLNTNDIELMCIALGHDLLEDTNVTEKELRYEGMSTRIIEGIKALTKEDGKSYDEYKSKVKANPDAVLVKIADITHNSDLSRIKNITQKDIDRNLRYYQFYIELVAVRNYYQRVKI